MVIIAGENRYACEKRLTGLISGKREDIIQVDASEPDSWPKIEEATLQGGSLFSAENTIVIRHLDEASFDTTKLLEVYEKAPSTSQTIVYLPGVKKGNSLIKKLSPLTKKMIIETLYSPSALVSWVEKTALGGGGSIDRATAGFLINYVGEDQLVLESEVNKLTAFNPNISRDTIKQVAVPSTQVTIFQMLEAMVQGKGEQALDLYRSLRVQQLDPYYIMSMICWQAHAITAAFAGRKKDMSEVARQTGLSPFVVKKAWQTSRNLSKSELLKMNEEILKTDVDLKSKMIDADRAVEQLVRKLSLARATS